MSRIRISHVFYSGLGGHTAVFWALEKFSSSQKYDLNVCLYGIEDPVPSTIEGCRSKQIPFSFDKKNGRWDVFHSLRLAISVYRTRAQVVFLHGSYGILQIVFLCKWIGGAKIISRETQALNLKNSVGKLRSLFALLLCDKVIYLTDDYRVQFLTGWRRYFRWKTEVISNGLDLDFYAPQSGQKLNGNKVRIGMQSRLVPIKDHATLIRAFDIIVNERGAKDLELQIAGEGTTFNEILRLIEEKNLGNCVKLVGRLEPTELANFLNRLDIYVHSSLGETMSNAIMQAQACGLPVIATDVFGINNVIINGENGYLFKLGDVDQLVSLILFLIKDKKVRTKLSLASRRFAEDKLSVEVMAGKYFSVFDSLFL